MLMPLLKQYTDHAFQFTDMAFQLSKGDKFYDTGFKTANKHSCAGYQILVQSNKTGQ
jgi:hypothetical protein